MVSKFHKLLITVAKYSLQIPQVINYSGILRFNRVAMPLIVLV